MPLLCRRLPNGRGEGKNAGGERGEPIGGIVLGDQGKSEAGRHCAGRGGPQCAQLSEDARLARRHLPSTRTISGGGSRIQESTSEIGRASCRERVMNSEEAAWCNYSQ